MPKVLKSPLEKVEKRFGKIESKDQAQMVVNTAKELLVERNKKLLAVLAKRIKVDEKKFEVSFKVMGLNNRVLVGAQCTDLELGNTLYIQRLFVGDYYRKTDSLRGLNLTVPLLARIKKYAKENGFSKIELSCNNKLLPTYLASGFIAQHRGIMSSDLVYYVK